MSELCPAITSTGSQCKRTGWLPHEGKLYCAMHEPEPRLSPEERNKLRAQIDDGYLYYRQGKKEQDGTN